MLKSFSARWLWSFLILLGCSAGRGDGNGSQSQGGGSIGGANASGGSPGGSTSGGAPAQAGATNSGGRSGLGTALGGSGGDFGAAATASGGHAMAAAGVGGSGGPTGGAGSPLAGSGGMDGRGPAPTFTVIYSAIITPNCGGAQCHLRRPTPFGYDFSSKSAASAAWRADVIAGEAESSPLFQVLNFGIMPKDKAALSIDQLFMVYDWINAGALDN